MRDYQLEGLNWMIQLRENGLNGILADEMGLGKTLQTISLLGYMLEYHHIRGPHIVLVPKSTLSNWMSEIRRWCPQLRPIKFHGTKDERAEMAAGPLQPGIAAEKREWDVVVTTYEVANIEKRTLEKFAWQYLVIDEAHRIKNENSTLSNTVRDFCVTHRLLLTGTPLQNNLHELWALLNFLLPDVFASSETFDEWFDLQGDDDEAKKSAISKLHSLLRPFMLRRLKRDVARSIPPKTETVLSVPMTSLQRQVYRNILKKDFDAITGSADRSKLNNLLMQMRKCCNHPYLFDGVEDRSLDPLGEHLITSCGKLVLLDKLLRRLQERGSRVLVFSQMTRLLDIMEDYCAIRGHKYCRIDGNSSYDVREQSIDSFNAPGSDIFLFLLSTRAGGLGINLATADTVILFDSDWNPQVDLQAQDRAHRIGQTKPVAVYRLVTEESVEEKIVERAMMKLKLDAVVVQQGRLQDKSTALSKAEMLEMVQFGASNAFRTDDAEALTDEDIDAILERGVAKTKALTKAVEEKVGDGSSGLLDFSLDGSKALRTFEGVDYTEDRSVKMERLRQLAFVDELHNALGKRERRTVSSYAISELSKASSQAVFRMPRGKKAGFRLKPLPRMPEFQLWPKEQIVEIAMREVELWRKQQHLPEADAKRKEDLIASAFTNWKKHEFVRLVEAMKQYGRYDMERLCEAVADTKTREEVEAYATAFWKVGPVLLSRFERIRAEVEKGEAALLRTAKVEAAVAARIVRSAHGNPWFHADVDRATRHFRAFTPENDRFLLCKMMELGYGRWKDLYFAVRTSSATRFDHHFRSRSFDEIFRRARALAKWVSEEASDVYARETMVEAHMKEREEQLKALTAEKAALDAEMEALLKHQDEALEQQKQRVAKLEAKVARAAAKAAKEARDKVGAKADAKAATPTAASSAASGGASGAAAAGGAGAGAAAASAPAALGTGNNPGSKLRRKVLIPDGVLPALARLIDGAGSTSAPQLLTEFTTDWPFSLRITRIYVNKIGSRGPTPRSLGDWGVRDEYKYLLEKEVEVDVETAARMTSAQLQKARDGGARFTDDGARVADGGAHSIEVEGPPAKRSKVDDSEGASEGAGAAARDPADVFPAELLPVLVAVVSCAGPDKKLQVVDSVCAALKGVGKSVPKKYVGAKISDVAKKQRRPVYDTPCWFIRHDLLHLVPESARNFQDESTLESVPLPVFNPSEVVAPEASATNGGRGAAAAPASTPPVVAGVKRKGGDGGAGGERGEDVPNGKRAATSTE